MDNLLGWIVFVAVAAFLLRPMFAGFKQGLRGQDETSDGGVHEFNADVVGESKYQSNLLKLAGRKTPEGVEKFATAALVFENENPYDREAVRVDIQGLTVGYLPKESARTWRKKAPGDCHACPAVIRGGWDRGGGDTGHFGVRLSLPRT